MRVLLDENKVITSIGIQEIKILFLLSLKQTGRNMKKLRLLAFALLLPSLLFLPTGTASDLPFENVPFDVTNIPEPVPPPEAVRDYFNLSSFWQQWINIEGFPILGSAKVSPYAVKETAWLLGQMFRHRGDILKALARGGQTFTMIAHNEVVGDIPELRDDPLIFYWNVRARGGLRELMGSSEEQVLGNAYVPIHEMAHAVLDIMYQQLDPPFDNRLGTVYNAAMEKGLWQGTFFALNKIEYWAEGVGVWFHANNLNPVKTRDALKAYDPDLARLIAEIFGDHDWRNTPIHMRTHLPHLQGFDPESAPRDVEFPPGVEEAYEELRDPAINERNEWVNLPLYDPSLLPRLNELRNRDPQAGWTHILVASIVDADVLFYWVRPDGTETLNHRFPPKPWQIDLFTCRVGDLFLAKDATGRPLAVFQAVEKTGRVLVAPTLHLITPGLSKISGYNQKNLSGTVLAYPFVVEVRDENLSVLEGISVTFIVTAGDGTLSVTHTTTDENGRAESTFTLGKNLGTNTVSVSAAGIDDPVSFNAVTEAPVNISDHNLRAIVEIALRVASGAPIVSLDMETLIRLKARNANISDLTGLEFATNLIMLDLTGNSLSDISPVAGLANLTFLDLDGNALSNISAVAGLTNLTTLDIWGTPISDISPVADLTNLTTLGLGHNNISDISPVAGLTNLTGLYLPRNHITDLSSLSGLTNLKTLWLNHNSISDLSPLVANTGLGDGDEVNVKGNPLSDHSIHTHIPALQSRGVTVEFDNRLEMGQNKITGPWLWMIAPTAPGQGGANSNNVDSLAAASNGDVTEAEVAANGAKEGDAVGNYVWALGKIAGAGGNNINDVINAIGMKQGDVNDHSSYALITLKSVTAQSNVTMKVGSDDSIKVWLNGKVVHNNPINRGAGDFQDRFTVNLKQGDNLLLVKVSERDGGWSMFIGIDADVNAVYKRPPDAVVSADVNSDGNVNVLDLILIASKLGNAGANLVADVNEDGVVNILDLILAAGMFEGTAAAPSAQPQAPETLTAVEVQGWLTDARVLEVKDPIMKRGFLVLEQLLVALTPKETELLSNYPNPFNPETWIPYRLAKDANVTLTIYDGSGQVVRTLDVGHRIAAAYENRSKAIYWDGRNDVGEQVASGIYFYTLTTRDFSATRRMVILK